jgi:hypothetical protein
MNTYYIFNDIVVGQDQRRGFNSTIKKLKDSKGVDEDNPNYNEIDSKNEYLKNVVRPNRNEILSLSDELELPSYRTKEGRLMGITKKSALVRYKDELRNMPQDILSGVKLDDTFPEPPVFISDSWISRYNEINEIQYTNSKKDFLNNILDNLPANANNNPGNDKKP